MKKEGQSVPRKKETKYHLAPSAKYLEIKLAAEDREGWRATNRR